MPRDAPLRPIFSRPRIRHGTTNVGVMIGPPIVTHGAAVTSAVVTATAAEPVPSITAQRSATVTPAVVTAPVETLAPSVGTLESVSLTAAVVTAAVSTLVPSVDAEQGVDVLAAVVTRTANVPAPTVEVLESVSLAAAVVTAAVNTLTPSVTAGASVTVSADVVTVSVETLDPSVDTPPAITVAAATVTATVAALTPSVTASVSVTISAATVTRTVAVRDPAVAVLQSVSIAPPVVTVTRSIPAPSVSAGVSVSILSATVTRPASARNPAVATIQSAHISAATVTRTAAVIAPTVSTPSRADLVWGVDQPTLLNTGVLAGVTRTAYVSGGFTSFPAGTYNNLNFTINSFNGLTLVNGRTYAFNNCNFTAVGSTVQRLINGTGAGTWTATFTDCTFGATWSAHTDNSAAGGHLVAPFGFRGHHATFLRCQARDLNDGLSPGGVVGATNVTIQQCYIDHFAFWRPDQNARVEGTHNDGISCDGGTGTQILGNTIKGFNNPTVGDAAFSEHTGTDGKLHGLNPGDDPEQWSQGVPIFVINIGANVSHNTRIEGNWLTGGQVQINVSGGGGTVTGTIIKNNRFGNDGTLDKGRYNKNVWIKAANYTAAADVSGNTQMDGSPVTVANGRIQLT